MRRLSETPPEEAFLAGGSTAVLARFAASKAETEIAAFINAEIQRPDFDAAHLMAGLFKQALGVQASLTAQMLKPSGDTIMRDAMIVLINSIFCNHAAAVRAELAQRNMETTP